MFGMIPFERHENNLFDAFDNFERNFFGNTSSAVTFRTDIRDEGDKFVLEAELPGFRKEDIQLHLKDGILTVSAQRTASRGTTSAGSAASAPSPAASTWRASTRRASPPPTRTASWS